MLLYAVLHRLESSRRSTLHYYYLAGRLARILTNFTGWRAEDIPPPRAAWGAPLAGSSAPRSDSPRIAYFSMEIALHPAMPTYSGGLGMLAGDMLRAAADRELPMVAVTLLHRKGYFYQTLDSSGWQTEASVEWIVEDFVRE